MFCAMDVTFAFQVGTFHRSGALKLLKILLWHNLLHIMRVRGVAASLRLVNSGDAHPGRLLEIRYEALHANPEAEIKRLLEFIQVASAPDIVESCLEAGSLKPCREDVYEVKKIRIHFFAKV